MCRVDNSNGADRWRCDVRLPKEEDKTWTFLGKKDMKTPYLKLVDNGKGSMITTTKCKVKVWTLKDEYSKQQTQQAIWKVTNNKLITTSHESKP
jgi:hypothetical protein